MKILMDDQHLELQTYKKMRNSLIFFVEQVWGLTPQSIAPAYQKKFEKGLTLKGKDWDEFVSHVTIEWFAPYLPDQNLTWQQSLIAYGIDKGLRGDIPLRISIVSGHGIGKSMISALILLWFLFAHADCQVACTSPGSEQLYDVLWKEIKKWIEKMPAGMADLYMWESSHIRMKESPHVWFARAKTASKENTEALAGVHADWVLILVDEASGVDEAIYETMEGALTSGNILVFLVSNGTRANGYFFDTHHKDAHRWQNYAFSSLDSPRVDKKYVTSIVDKYGLDSAQYAIRVLGQFPKEDGMDDAGFVPLVTKVPTQPDYHELTQFYGPILGVDCAGEGRDKSIWVLRDGTKAKKIAEEAISNSKTIAERTLTLMKEYEIRPENVVIDAFGVGANVSMEIALASRGTFAVIPVNVGDPSDEDEFMNLRAEWYWKLRQWLNSGGEIVEHKQFIEQLKSIRYKRNIKGKIQIMSKEQMKKTGFNSPDMADALMLTFYKDIPMQVIKDIDRAMRDREMEDFDPHEVLPW